MKIYTKAGDKGQTSLIGGKRVPKYHGRIEAYGTVDELISYTGLLRDMLADTIHAATLLYIQDRLMTAASILAAENDDQRKKLPVLKESDIEFLESEIDRMEDSLKPLKSFILPGGNPVVSFCHIARTVCRRAERAAVKISENSPTEDMVTRYLNRLSDFFFVFARLISNELGAQEIIWTPLL
jgi:cob(I)alamin adenosyltransferase